MSLTGHPEIKILRGNHPIICKGWSTSYDADEYLLQGYGLPIHVT